MIHILMHKVFVPCSGSLLLYMSIFLSHSYWTMRDIKNVLLYKTLAALLHIELLYLPSYSPNLNLIERLWKFVKKQCLYSKYYADYDAFTTAIADCLQHTHDQYKKGAGFSSDITISDF